MNLLSLISLRNDLSNPHLQSPGFFKKDIENKMTNIHIITTYLNWILSKIWFSLKFFYLLELGPIIRRATPPTHKSILHWFILRYDWFVKIIDSVNVTSSFWANFFETQLIISSIRIKINVGKWLFLIFWLLTVKSLMYKTTDNEIISIAIEKIWWLLPIKTLTYVSTLSVIPRVWYRRVNGFSKIC